MLTVNMQRPYHPYNRRRHPQISHGVNPDQYKTYSPSLQELMMDGGIPGADGPKHLADPFHFPSHTGLEFSEPQAEYNNQGTFSISAKMAHSRNQTIHQMKLDTNFNQIVNNRRPKI